MYYIVSSKLYKSFDTVDSNGKVSHLTASLIGWTTNPYVVQSLIDQFEIEDPPIIINSYDVSTQEFLEILDEDFDVDISMRKEFELKILSTNTGRSVVTTEDRFNDLCNSSIVYEILVELVNSIRRLRVLRPYIRSEEVNTFIEYIWTKYIPYTIETLYVEGDCYNTNFDMIYLMVISDCN